MPLPTRVRGRVRLFPQSLPGMRYALDAAGRHHWQPIAPLARVEVAFDAPALRWSGSGYLDANAGAVPLEDDFARWTWARMRRDAHALVLYDVEPRAGAARGLALQFDADGGVLPVAVAPPVPLEPTGWRLPRAIRADAGHAPRVLRTLEDMPFYARSIVATELQGAPVTAMHECLSLDRFAAPWVQRLLPFRMRRSAR